MLNKFERVDDKVFSLAVQSKHLGMLFYKLDNYKDMIDILDTVVWHAPHMVGGSAFCTIDVHGTKSTFALTKAVACFYREPSTSNFEIRLVDAYDLRQENFATLPSKMKPLRDCELLTRIFKYVMQNGHFKK